MAELRLGNPAPLGLMGFGMTTVLLNLHNAGFYPLNAMILAMGLVYGGLAQVTAGVMEFRRGSTFGMTAFTSYGFFWLSLVFLIVFPTLGLGQPVDNTALASYLFMWGLFTFGMFFGTLKANRTLQFVLITLAILFFILSAGNATQNSILIRIGGVEGILCGSSAIYLSLAEVVNETYGRTVLPIGKVRAS